MCALLGPKDMDIECQEKKGRERVRCLDVCVVVSILVLFAALTVVAAACVPALMKLSSQVDSPLKPFQFATAELRGLSPSPAYQMQNFAFLEAVSSKLGNSTVQWDPVHYSAGESVGSNFQFDSKQHLLRPRRAGTYFIYLNLNLTCTYRCSAGLLSVRVGDKLSCQVHLLAESEQESKRCWTVGWLDTNTRLLTHMSVPKEGLQNWKLELNGSNLGMFLVD
ncbi:uncharacterized protein LOC133476302 [Phyllopteryx taeniolatus]|uniref:uncharacterized protein LOC133476302 n=1 Tax=Phyllopteryx taeniolatus TaxID=161469 RepID=UPI002AD32E66|nr:uncharacterized protein LOC133476302 [Phyllopteryx taeniolatus]XP_061625483.1 uncharacterized protein LOC133476302 [Phyllopteryx taeniolatus]